MRHRRPGNRLAQLATASAKIVGLDYSPPMLEKAAEKAKHLPLKAELNFIHGDVHDLPFPDEYFDSIGISFAFRNLTYKNPNTPRYLSEILRVLKNGGQFVIVESSQPSNKLIRALDHFYLRTFVRWMGTYLSKNKTAYNYLTESASKFFTAEEISDFLVKQDLVKLPSNVCFLVQRQFMLQKSKFQISNNKLQTICKL